MHALKFFLYFTNFTGEELSKKQAAQEGQIRKLRAQVWAISDTGISASAIWIIFYPRRI